MGASGLCQVGLGHVRLLAEAMRAGQVTQSMELG